MVVVVGGWGRGVGEGGSSSYFYAGGSDRDIFHVVLLQFAPSHRDCCFVLFFSSFCGNKGGPCTRPRPRVSSPTPTNAPGAESGDAGPYAATAAAAKSCRMHSEIRQREMMTVEEEEEERERHEGKAINGRRGRNKRGPRRNW